MTWTTAYVTTCIMLSLHQYTTSGMMMSYSLHKYVTTVGTVHYFKENTVVIRSYHVNRQKQQKNINIPNGLAN